MTAPPPSSQPAESVPPTVPGAHVDDSSVAGEEDPGAGLEELVRPPAAPQPPAPGPSG